MFNKLCQWLTNNKQRNYFYVIEERSYTDMHWHTTRYGVLATSNLSLKEFFEQINKASYNSYNGKYRAIVNLKEIK